MKVLCWPYLFAMAIFFSSIVSVSADSDELSKATCKSFIQCLDQQQILLLNKMGISEENDVAILELLNKSILEKDSAYLTYPDVLVFYGIIIAAITFFVATPLFCWELCCGRRNIEGVAVANDISLLAGVDEEDL